MEQIKSYEQYRDLVSEAKKMPNLCSNWYFLPEVVRKKIDMKILFWEEISGGFLLLEKEFDFFRCYYFLDTLAPVRHLDLPLPGVIEFVYQNKMTLAQEAQVDLLYEMGFSLGRESGRMFCSAEQIHEIPCESITVSSQSEIQEINYLIHSTFDPRYAFLSSEEQMLRDLCAGRIFEVREGRELLGVLYSELSNGVASIRQLVVAEPYRSRGLGGQLLSYYHKTYRKQVKKFVHWVDLKNDSAICFYKKFGYVLDGRCANEYIIS